MLKRIFFILFLFAFYSMLYAQHTVDLSGFQAICKDYNAEESFSLFLEHFVFEIEKDIEEKAFMLLYSMPGDESLDNGQITAGVITQRYIRVEYPVYIRVFQDADYIKKSYRGDEASFLRYYRALLQDYAGKGIALGGIPIVFFSIEDYLEHGNISGEIFIPVK